MSVNVHLLQTIEQFRLHHSCYRFAKIHREKLRTKLFLDRPRQLHRLESLCLWDFCSTLLRAKIRVPRDSPRFGSSVSLDETAERGSGTRTESDWPRADLADPRVGSSSVVVRLTYLCAMRGNHGFIHARPTLTRVRVSVSRYERARPCRYLGSSAAASHGHYIFHERQMGNQSTEPTAQKDHRNPRSELNCR